MMKDEFSTEYLFNMIYTVELIIRRTYDKLIQLELNNNKNSDTYNSLKNQLDGLKKLEDFYFGKIDGKKAIIIERAIESYGYISFEDYFYKIYSTEESKNIIARISYKIEDILDEEDKKQALEDDDEDIFDDEMDNIDYAEYGEIYRHYIENSHCMDILQKSVEYDLLNTFLKILNEYIINPRYENIKSTLIRYKYLISYIFPEIEQEFIKNNFDINNNLYWGSKLIVDMYSEDEELLNFIKSNYADYLLFENCDHLLNMMSFDIHHGENYAKAISFQIIIRACSLFVSEDTLNDSNCILMDCLNEMGHNNIEVENIIKNSINKIKIDKELPLKLSLKPEKN